MRMDTEAKRFARLREIFHAGVALDAAARALQIEQLRAEDERLARELAELWRHLEPRDLQEPETASVIGQRFGPFAIEAEIGRGGMGVVYRAQRVDGAFAQQVAIKLMPPHLATPARRQRFRQERDILARLQHPGIARLLDGGIDAQGRLWLAMELVEGERLDACMARPGIDLPQAVVLLLQVCEAVAAAHAQLVVHRDLKPGNVLVDRLGQARLLDFGIASLDEEAVEAWAVTPRYAAPELKQGQASGTAVDVYAMGCMLDDALKLPARPGRAEELRRVRDVACAPDPAARYASMAALAADLKDWLAGRPLRSGIGSARARRRWLLREYRWLWAGLALTLAGLSSGGWMAWQASIEAQRQAAIAASHRDSLLDLLAIATPGDFGAREPGVGEFLLDAAAALREHAEPELTWRSHVQIAVGLINLGRAEDADRLLRLARASLDAWPEAGAERRWTTLRLLALVYPAAQRADFSRFAAEVLAESERAQASESAIRALSATAQRASKLGEMVSARACLAQAERLRLAVPPLSTAMLEDYARQRAQALLRMGEFDAAGAAFELAAQAMQAPDAEFSPMRRAELQRLQAEWALLSGQPELALARLAEARPTYQAAFAPTHAESLWLAWIEWRARRLLGLPEQIEFALIDSGLRGVQQSDPDSMPAGELVVLDAWQAALADRACQLPRLPGSAPLPHQQAAWAQAQAWHQARCAGE